MKVLHRGLVAASLALSALAYGSPACAAYTDLGQYNTDIRKARDDVKSRLEIHLKFLRDSYDEAIASKNEPMLRLGLKEKLNIAIHDYIAFSKDPNVNRDDAVRIGQALEALRIAILAGPEQVRKAILNEPAPKDVYSGKDRNDMKSQIVSAWKERYPGEEIVAIRFDRDQWERRRERNWIENGKYFQNVDVSTLTVRVIVRKDAETATIYGIHMQRDNDNPGKGAQVGRKGIFEPKDILLANVR